MDLKKQLNYFNGLPYEKKREKVLDMLKQLQNTHETFAMFYATINKLNKVSEKILIYIYQWILEIATEIESGNKGKAKDKIKTMGEVLMMIKKQEELERTREGNPDDMLNSI